MNDHVSIILNQARQIADTFGRSSIQADRENSLPLSAIEALKSSDLLKLFAPERLGGIPCDFATYSKVCSIFGAECLSLGFIWLQHIQQLAVLSRHGQDQFDHVIRDVTENGALLASVTTELGKGGDLLHAEAPLSRESGQIRVRRVAPVVGYGEAASWYLTTMKSLESSPLDGAALVVIHKADPGRIEISGAWNAMGMRGTQTVPMTFDVLVAPERIFQCPFRRLASQTMIPFAHVGWASIWYGAAKSAFSKTVKLLRKSPARLTSDLTLNRLGKTRISLELMKALLASVCVDLDRPGRDGSDAESLDDVSFTIKLNSLKVACADLSLASVDALIEILGLSKGYLRDDDVRIEQLFRDLRAAPLLFHNDRLLMANGKLSIFESSEI